VNDGPRTTLSLMMKSDLFEEFLPLLQQGVWVIARVGCSLEELLGSQWGISPEYVAQRITTIFLNGRAIDDVTSAIVTDSSTIALSGAMPGLVGATMRRGGYYAAMRSGITYTETGTGGGARAGTIRVKLFNLLLRELGPLLLRRGIILTGEELAAFMARTSDSFRHGSVTALLNGDPVPFHLLRSEGSVPQGESLCLTVDFKDQP
jgi:hypothetical protein